MQAKLYEKSRQQVEQLQQLLAAKSEFLDAVSHELRTPLTTMKMAIQVLRQPELSAERQAKYLDLLEQEWQREYGLIQDLLALQKLESNQVTIDYQHFDLKEMLNSLVSQFQQKWQSKGLGINIDYDPPKLADAKKSLLLYSDADSVRQVLQELLTNAGKYSYPETVVAIQIQQAAPQY
ncbi:MAG: HAMP domain-containing histidine kinase, partial [Spirulinaceae cyanobacterium RM2_2_10]|nr:HAMP domain-containing histidine kinase [Spirulinaceae cyanobacterium RM2_2_10]